MKIRFWKRPPRNTKQQPTGTAGQLTQKPTTITCLTMNLQKDEQQIPIAANQFFGVCHQVCNQLDPKNIRNTPNVTQVQYDHDTTLIIYNHHTPLELPDANATHPNTKPPNEIDIIIYTFLLGAQNNFDLAPSSNTHDLHQRPHILLLGITPIDPKTKKISNQNIDTIKLRLKTTHYIEFTPWSITNQTMHEIFSKIIAITEKNKPAQVTSQTSRLDAP